MFMYLPNVASNNVRVTYNNNILLRSKDHSALHTLSISDQLFPIWQLQTTICEGIENN